MTQFSLTDDQIAIRDMALAFAAENLAPHALEWDEKKHFPVDVMREAAALGMAAIYTRDDVGGSGMTRLDAALIFEALATGCPADLGLSVDPQHGHLDDRPLRLRRAAPALHPAPRHHGADRRAIA